MARERHNDALTLDGLTFAVRWSDRRRTIGITVRDDGRLEIAVPSGSRMRQVEEVVRGKLPWVRRKLAEAAARPAPPERRWVDGERLPYLGVEYPLILVADGGVPVRLYRGRFLMEPAAADDGRRTMIDWYTRRARAVIDRRLPVLCATVAAEPSSIVVKDLGRRWGTCDAHGRLRFHWQIVQFPQPVFDYIVVHELAHLHELNHSALFWRRVERALPEYRAHKAWLRSMASGYGL
jgi:hypothetical protein